MWLLYAIAIFPGAFFHLFFIPDQPRADPDQGRKDFVTIVAPILFIILPVIAIYQLTVLVVPPGLANPRGEIVLIKQLPQTMFIDSPTALCARLAPELEGLPENHAQNALYEIHAAVAAAVFKNDCVLWTVAHLTTRLLVRGGGTPSTVNSFPTTVEPNFLFCLSSR